MSGLKITPIKRIKHGVYVDGILFETFWERGDAEKFARHLSRFHRKAIVSEVV